MNYEAEIKTKCLTFLSRSSSSLEFNKRILHEATNKANLITSRLKFLAISFNNLDEFQMVQYARSNAPRLHVNEKCRQIRITQQAIWEEIKSELMLYDVKIINPEIITPQEKEEVQDYLMLNYEYQEKIINAESLLSALPNLHNVALLPYNAEYKILLPEQKRDRIIKLTKNSLIFTADMLKIHHDSIISIIRVIRDANISDQDIITKKIDRKLIKELAMDQYRGQITSVQLCTSDKILQQNLQNTHSAILYETKQNLDLSSIDEISSILSAKLTHNIALPIAIYPCIKNIAKKDIILHHPYQSFNKISNFLKHIAEDPNVISIKQTIYRTEKNDISHAIYASQLGKEVTIIIESRARFDEINNINLAEYLQNAGVKVILNTSGIKIHSKFCLIERKEEQEIKYYLHYSTGNYNSITAATYQDISLLTANQKLCHDIRKIFHYLTKETEECETQAIYVSPFNLRNKLIELIKQETQNAQSGVKCGIWIKCNAITDREIINNLYQASIAGVKINIAVRGVCLIAPEKSDISANIQIRSIIGKVLEHSRIYCFGNKNTIPSTDTEVYISSADLMERNFDKRIETMIPIYDAEVKNHILYEIMTQNIANNNKSWKMDKNGTYTELHPTGRSIHDYFNNLYK